MTVAVRRAEAVRWRGLAEQGVVGEPSEELPVVVVEGEREADLRDAGLVFGL